MAVIESHQLRVPTSDGLELFTQVYKAPSAKAQILIIHGYAEHCSRYREFAEYLVNHDFEVWTFDLRGHGHSPGRRGFISRFSEYLIDLSAVAESMSKANTRKLPQLCLGHSMGGLALANWLREHRARKSLTILKACAFSAPFLGMSLEVPLWKRTLGTGLSRVWPKLALANEITVEDLTSDLEKRREWQQDRLIFHKVPARWFSEALSAQERMNAEVALDLPIAVFQGTADSVASIHTSKQRLEQWQAPEKSWHEFAGLKHEILNEKTRLEVFEAILNWLNKQLN